MLFLFLCLRACSGPNLLSHPPGQQSPQQDPPDVEAPVGQWVEGGLVAPAVVWGPWSKGLWHHLGQGLGLCLWVVLSCGRSNSGSMPPGHAFVPKLP
eukprot:902256-Pelagomonas_calceolata.AAC.1